ncbi:hypothetical protein [Arthrobacter sp. 754]|uniref:hypothetical protein n=1 Tax=Arthrobacter sp. 754 TaxID=3156315 RepID=UPI0033952CF7
MTAFGLTLFAVGGVGLFATVLFSLVDKQKTGILFRQKKVVLPVAFGSGALGLIGMLIVYLSQQP